MKKTLLVIDVQKGVKGLGQRNNPNAEQNIALLLAKWRKKNLPIVHIQHLSTDKNSLLYTTAGQEFKPEALPLATEKVFQKNVNSAFIGTGLEQYLKDSSMLNLVIVGLTTEHCISTSVRMAANLGFRVELIADAIANYAQKSYTQEEVYSAEQVHKINLASLNKEFCKIVHTKDLLDEN